MKTKTMASMLALVSLLFILSGCGPSKDVISAINAIDAIGEVTIDSGSAIGTAETAYDALPEGKQSDVTNYDTLVQARDQFDILSAIDAIDAIGNVTINSGSAIETAEEAYENLSETQRVSIDNYEILQEALKEFEFIKIGNKVKDDKYFVFSDENMTIELIDGPDALNDFGNYGTLLEAIDNTIEDINEEFGLPDSLYNKMMKTSLADGVQTQTFDNVAVSWSFDPTAFGLSVLYKFIPNT